MSGIGGQTPIIKKIKKKGHEQGHGGSWKVAYADFVTAMMAFFLLLWLVSMVSEDKRARVSEYFKSFNLFDKGGKSFVADFENSKSSIKLIDVGGAKNASQENNTENAAGGSSADQIKDKLKKEVEEKLSNMKDQVLVDIFEGAVRIEIVDKNGGSAMFDSGSKEMTEEGKRAFKVIADNLKNISGKIAIEGHTDASTYTGRQYSNWELSTDRASAARRELENSGLSPDRLIRVAGYAATDPLIPEDPFDPKNRRISIRVFQEGNHASNNTSEVSSQQLQGNKENQSGNFTGEKDKDDPIDKYLLSK